jgi:flagellar protein FlaG
MSIQSISTSLTFQAPTAQVADATAAIRGVSARQSGTLTTLAAKGAAAADAATTATQSREAQNEQSLSAAISSVEEYIKPFNNRLEFNVDEDVGRVVVKVVDKETDEVLLQVPSEEMLAIAKALDNIKGLFVKQQA